MNFVSTTVLSSKDGISHDTETRLQPDTTASDADRAYAKPLYEQLRANAQEAQDKYDEETAAMRGMVALDEDDMEFLTTVENTRNDRLMAAKKREQEELEMFRAARMEKGMVTSEIVEDEEVVSESPVIDGKNVSLKEASQKVVNGAPPKIMVKRKRRRKDANLQSAKKSDEPRPKKLAEDSSLVSKEGPRTEKVKKEDPPKKEDGALDSLLIGYGSDSSSD